MDYVISESMLHSSQKEWAITVGGTQWFQLSLWQQSQPTSLCKKLLNDSYQSWRNVSIIHISVSKNASVIRISVKQTHQWFLSMLKKILDALCQWRRNASMIRIGVFRKRLSDTYHCGRRASVKKWRKATISNVLQWFSYACGRERARLSLHEINYRLVCVPFTYPWFTKTRMTGTGTLQKHIS